MSPRPIASVRNAAGNLESGEFLLFFGVFSVVQCQVPDAGELSALLLVVPSSASGMNSRSVPPGPLDPLGLGPAWAALVEHTSDFVGLMDEEGIALLMNRSVRGASQHEVEGKPLEEFLGPKRAEQIRSMLEESKRTGQVTVNENLKVLALDGRERWFVEKCVPIPRPDGRTHFMLVRTETTHLRQTEAELRASEERYRVLFESNPDPVLVYDPESLRFLAANAAALRMYGLSEEDLLEKRWLDLHPEAYREEALRWLTLLRTAPNREHRGVVTQVRADGSELRAEVIDNPIQFGGRAARISVHRDVTERERLEEQLRQSQKMEAVGVFAGGVAHDFNNLLGIIGGCAEAARESVEPGSVVADDLMHVIDSVRRGAELTKKLLVFSKKQLLTLEYLDLAEVVVDFATILRRILPADMVLEVVQEHAPIPLVADRTQIEQVVLNLVTNARQAMPHGGRVQVHASRLKVDAAYVARHPWAKLGRFAELRVTDEGTGMDPGTAARIFEPFFTTRTEGTGLGLAVVHGIVQQHQGRIGVESRPGTGTTFRILLPEASEAVEANTARMALGVPRGSERVLFAEDEPILRQITERALRRLGYRVVATQNGEEAVREFEQEPDGFDLVVLDVVMPKLGGRDALMQMRARRPELKALFVTGYAPEATGMVDVVSQPGLGILKKPFTSLELAERVRQVLEHA